MVVRKQESQMDLDEDEEETTLVEEADVLITRFRAGSRDSVLHSLEGQDIWFHQAAVSPQEVA